MPELQPLLNPNFFGRERELAWLEDRLRRRHSNAAVFVVGINGVGKTALVKQWLASRVYRWATPWEDFGLEWLDLGAKTNPEVELTNFIENLYVGSPQDGHGRRRESAVVIDGADALSDSSLEIAFGRLFNLKRVKSVVVTSRRDPSIERAEVLSLSGLALDDTEQLLRTLTQTNLSPSDIGEALNATQGLPLAVALLAKLIGLGDGGATLAELLAKPLYDVRSALPVPESSLLEAVRPRIVSAKEALIEQLKRHPSSIHDLPHRKFEELIADLLSDLGWRVELTAATRDGGKDILAYLNTEVGELLCLVEAKKYRPDRKVGVELVRTLYGTLCDYQANSAMLVTTSSFSPDAVAFQMKHQYQLSLREYAHVAEWIQRYKTLQ
jgi:HJR/Mrr/RecB family endonuclease